MINQSIKLTEFYRDYRTWLLNEAPQDKPFDTRNGLCGNLHQWLMQKYGHLDVSDRYSSIHEMKVQFREAKLDAVYPFNSPTTFGQESFTQTTHLNPARIAWVEEHANV